MTRIKLCGLRFPEDIKTACELKPDYIGFVFAPAFRRYIPPEKARALKEGLSPEIRAVGVFVNERPEAVASLLNAGLIDLAQLHGGEDESYISRLRSLTDGQLIQAFRIRDKADLSRAEQSSADFILLDAGTGEGRTFDWTLLSSFSRPYFLAGGLTPDNVSEAVRLFHPWGVDVSSGIETDGRKDPEKMRAFVRAVKGSETV